MPFQRRRSGFTLIELLTVIGIIVLLLAILLPVVGQVRVRAYVTNTQGELQRISTAIQNYYNEQNAYPGPLSNAMLVSPNANPKPIQGVKGTITSSENLVLGLLGFLDVNPTSGAISLSVNSGTKLPNIPPLHDVVSLNTLHPASYHYIDAIPEELSTGMASTLAYAAGQTVTDSLVPEFVDKIPDPMPILYVRANVGQPASIPSGSGGVVASPDNSLQYNYTLLKDYGSYLRIPGTSGKGNSGMWLMFTQQSLATMFGQKNNLASDESTPYPNFDVAAPNNPGYFANPNAANTPRGRDTFILISAGQDRTYGTQDDLIVTP